MAKVRLADRAVTSLLRHDAWLRRRNPSAADRLRVDVEGTLRLLADWPEVGHRIEGTRSRSYPTRRYRYRLVYVVDGNDVEVVAVLHPRQAGP